MTQLIRRLLRVPWARVTALQKRRARSITVQWFSRGTFFLRFAVFAAQWPPEENWLLRKLRIFLSALPHFCLSCTSSSRLKNKEDRWRWESNVSFVQDQLEFLVPRSTLVAISVCPKCTVNDARETFYRFWKIYETRDTDHAVSRCIINVALLKIPDNLPRTEYSVELPARRSPYVQLIFPARWIDFRVICVTGEMRSDGMGGDRVIDCSDPAESHSER